MNHDRHGVSSVPLYDASDVPVLRDRISNLEAQLREANRLLDMRWFAKTTLDEGAMHAAPPGMIERDIKDRALQELAKEFLPALALETWREERFGSFIFEHSFTPRAIATHMSQLAWIQSQVPGLNDLKAD
jgi:hypothetical protein